MRSRDFTAAGRRVVVTGVGAVTPLGLDVKQSWEGLLEGRSGIGPITAFEADDLPTSIAGEVRDFDPAPYMSRTVARRTDLYAQYAIAAAQQAVAASGLVVEDGPDALRTGVLMGSGYGAVNSIDGFGQTIRTKGPRGISPYAAVTGAIDSAAGEISMALHAQGPSRAVSSACATGADAVGEAARWIRLGIADVVVCGGAENCLTRVDLAGTGNARALSRRVDEPERACRPFDADRDGFVMSAGAGALVLESADHARARGAEVLGEVAGYAATSDAHHWTAPHPEGLGARRAITAALDDAGVEPGDVDHVNAHGTGTRLNDTTELDALYGTLGGRVREIPVSAVKSMTGHMIGAAGAFEAVVGLLTISTGVVPPTVNCDSPIDPDVDFVTTGPQERDVRVVLSNSFGFGGHNAVLVLRAVEEL